MPRGVKNTPPTPPMKADTIPSAPAPMIILQPQADGTLINAYGLEMAECIDELRRALLHLVARQSGVTIISETVSRHAAVVAMPALKVPPPVPPANGTGPKKPLRLKETKRRMESWDDEPDLREDLAAALDSIEV